MDLNTLRTLHAIGNYAQIISELPNSSICNNNPEFLVLAWKSILKCTGDVSKCAQFLGTRPISDILKKSLMLWSKIYKSHINGTVGNNSDNVKALQELGVKAHETVEIEQEERDQIILISVEALLMLSEISQAFSLLKLLKASNLDW